MKEDEMDVYLARMRDENAYAFLVQNLKRRGHVPCKCIDIRITLNVS
jgi:hypothetical protein